MVNCVFCKIVSGELPASKIYEDEELLAFMDIQPVENGHVLIIPKKHFQYLSDVPDNILTKIILLTKKIQTVLRTSEIKAQDLNLFVADGPFAGQEVPHFHLHIIPRYENDGFGLKFREGYEIRPAKEHLDNQARMVAKALSESMLL